MILCLGNNLVSLVGIKGILHNSAAAIITNRKAVCIKETLLSLQVGDLADSIIQFSSSSSKSEAIMG